MKKKVLIVTSVASMIEQFNKSNIQILQEQGYEVEIACNFLKGNTCNQEDVQKLQKELNNLSVVSHQIDFVRSPLSLGMLHSFKQIKKVIVKGNYQLIHCQSPVASILTRLIAKNHRKKGTKVIYTAHGFHFFKGAPLQNWLLYYPIEKYCSRFTDVLITINQEDYALAQRKMKAKKIVYIPGVGVDTQKYADVTVDKPLKKKELGIHEDSFVLLSVGELSTRKNHQIIIKALAKLNKKDIHYLIAGNGDEKEHLSNLAEELGIRGQVHLLGYRADIGELCKVADVFCFPSLQEGLPVALMEAMGSGLPCVVSKIRGNTDLIEEEKGGFLVGPTSVDEFVKSIQILVDDEEKRVSMGRYNMEAVKKFDRVSVDGEMRGIYHKLYG